MSSASGIAHACESKTIYTIQSSANRQVKTQDVHKDKNRVNAQTVTGHVDGSLQLKRDDTTDKSA